ncbi:gliding motility protein GldB-related protein [Flavobacterium wongokense]|uniref:gliding motility protein GldB-related protein n=1 Tax=Flavobacterium wongokense TaxID=2910674 RepID=UPI001F2E5BF9|nr:DUF2268 domain-containing putative Zn-dependent protease [Flavobacterium sp. WG47]MCF6132228.1 DUF2268 domain-containing protein [Flavobacterium sp. WG47]
MKQSILSTLLLLVTVVSFGQTQKIEFGKEYPVSITKELNSEYSFQLQKGGLYAVSVLQQGIDVKLVFSDGDNKQILEKDSPNGSNGYEQFEFTPTATSLYHLNIIRLDEEGNAEKGKVTVLITKISKVEIQRREKIKKELAPENGKIVQTLDIDHFWQAFDNLKQCKTRNDSIHNFQTVYLDRATDGLKDFIIARQFTAEKFVDAVAHFPKFYKSVRKNTYEVKNAVPLVEEIVSKFQQIYPNFTPHKVCFAIGIVNTGGTVSDKFLLIGTEVSTSTKNTDLSEFKNSAFGKQLASGDDVIQKIKNIVAHEYVHTQQNTPFDKNAISCGLLYSAMQEGFCDFIGELTSGSQINLVGLEYGDKNEKQVWKDFKSELCNSSNKNWLYNYSSVKDKPADLGYYVGYKIAQEYYKNAPDKKQAVIDIIEMNDPIKFLQLSRYDQKPKN